MPENPKPTNAEGPSVTRLLKIGAGLVVVMALAAAGLFGTEYVLAPEAGAAQDTESGDAAATRVGVASPERRTFENEVSAVGTIAPLREVEIVPAVSGRVTGVAVLSGEAVEAGALLLRLDDRAERAALGNAEATLREARQARDRVEQLADANTAAENQLESARAAFARAEADVAAARATLEDRRVRAPFAGTLGFVDTDPGAFVSSESVIARLSDLSAVKVDFSLPERYFRKVEPGQKLELTVPAYPDATFEGEVTVRDSAVATGSRSFQVRAELSNADRRLVGGMFAHTRLVFDSRAGLAVPDEAIVSEGAQTFVYAVAEGEARRRRVSLGASAGSLTEITDGLAPDDRIVVTGWSTLRDGAPVEIAGDVSREGLE